MGIYKSLTPFNNKKDVYSNISNIRLTVHVKASLIKISSDEIKSKRIPAYKYLLP